MEEKTQLQKRFESFLWRTGMMVVALLIDWLMTNIGLFNLPMWTTGVLGLLLGEASKWVNNYLQGKV